jgi:hypothetical protein
MEPEPPEPSAGGSHSSDDLTKILEFENWHLLGGKELKHLAEVAEVRACSYFSLGTEWGRMMSEQWRARTACLLEAAQVAGEQ